LIFAERSEATIEHKRYERIGISMDVLLNNTFFSIFILVVQHPIMVRRHSNLMISAPNGKKE